MVKHPFRYWFWRIYAPVVWLVVMSMILKTLSTLDLAYLRMCVLATPFYVPAVFAIGNPWIFPFDYSVFGRYRRTPLPDETPLRIIGNSADSFRLRAIAGRSNMGPVIWLLYRDGIGIKMLHGRAFIPREEIEALDLEHGLDVAFCRNSMSTLYHCCPEIREPIYVSKWAAKIMAGYYPEKVLVEAEAV